jgi:hypothetical protein
MRRKAKRATPKLYSWVIGQDDLARFDTLFREAGAPFDHPLTQCRGWATSDGTPKRLRGTFAPGETCQINLLKNGSVSMSFQIALKTKYKKRAAA